MIQRDSAANDVDRIRGCLRHGLKEIECLSLRLAHWILWSSNGNGPLLLACCASFRFILQDPLSCLIAYVPCSFFELWLIFGNAPWNLLRNSYSDLMILARCFMRKIPYPPCLRCFKPWEDLRRRKGYLASSILSNLLRPGYPCGSRLPSICSAQHDHRQSYRLFKGAWECPESLTRLAVGEADLHSWLLIG